MERGRVSRARALRSFAAAAALGSAALAAGAEEAEVVRVATIPIDPAGEAFYAFERGFFRDEGLDARVQTLGNGAEIASAVASGAIDVGFANLLSLAQAHLRGVPIVLLFPGSLYSGADPATNLMVALDSPLRNAKDLAGKTVGVPGLNNVTQLAVMAWADRNGGDGKAIRFVEFPPPVLPQSVIAGRIDAAIVTEPFLTLNAAKLRVLAPAMDAIGREFVIGGWFTSKAWAAKHPAAAAKVASAFRRTARWANTHRRESAAILSTYTKVPVALASRMVRTPYAEAIVPAAMQIELDVAARYGMLERTFPVRELVIAERAR